MSSSQYKPGQVLPGTVYRVVRHLATGGMGSVYEVEDITVEKRYVLKTLHPDLVAREDLVLRMRDEAKSLAKLQHPNIVDVVTAGVTSDAQKMPFYVMERLIGQNLRVVLEKTGALRVLHAYRIAIDVADALEHAHENNIVHRDVKPENIFLHRNANGTTATKLLDFGIVRLLDRKASRTHGKFIGTLRYASPEQVTGQKVGPTTDIYSLALVLFEMLAGRGPFDDTGDAYVIGASHANTPPPPLSQFVRGVSPDVERLVASALAKDPEERPRDCFAFSSELRRILREEEANPGSATAVNLLMSSPPPSMAVQPVASGSVPSDPTVQGMIPPTLVTSSPPPAITDAPTTRVEGRADGGGDPINPIATTLAAARPVSYPPNGNAGAAPRPAAGVPAIAGAPRVAAGGIDRSAPTRASARRGETQRLAKNDTQMVQSASGDARRARFGEPIGVDDSPVARAGSSPGDLGFSPAQGANATGPLSGEASTRPPERSPYTVVGAAALFALATIAGAFLLVRKPWQSANVSDAPEESAVAAASAPPHAEASIAPAPAATASVAPIEAESAVDASAPSEPAPAEPSQTSPVAEPPPSSQDGVAAPTIGAATSSARTKVRMSPPPAPTRATATVETKPRAPAPPKEIPFDP